MRIDEILYFSGAIFIVLICFAIYAWKFLKSPTEAQKRMIKEWLLLAVIEAEKLYRSGTGAVKLRYVYSLFIEKFPAIAQIISFELFALWVDEALEQMRHLLETNLDIAAYVEGEQ